MTTEQSSSTPGSPYKRFIPDPENNPIWAVVASVVLLSEFFHLLAGQVSNVGLYVAMAILGLSAVAHIWQQTRLTRGLRLPKKTGVFRPFGVTDKDVWPREQETNNLAKLIYEGADRHIMITGPSGAGKSTIIEVLLLQPVRAKGFTVDVVDRYDSPVFQFILALGNERNLTRKYRAFMSKNVCSVKEAFGSELQDVPEAKDLWLDIQRYIQIMLPVDKKHIFLFDQMERIAYLTRIDSALSRFDFNGFEIYFFCKVIEYLRSMDHIRTVFVVRAEYVYFCYNFFRAPVGAHEDLAARPSTLIEFLCPGINSSSAPSIPRLVSESFKRTAVPPNLVPDFLEATALENRQFSNTFLAQLCGYILEHYWDTKDRDLVRKMIVPSRSSNGTHEPHTNLKLCITYYFGYLLNDYGVMHRSADSREFLKIVMFALATENRLAGQAVTEEKLAALAHLPVPIVREVIAYLRDRHLVHLESSEQQENLGQLEEGKVENSFRLVNDILTDYIIDNEQFAIHTRLKDSIRGLSDARAGTLTPITKFASLFDFDQINSGLVCIWLFIIYGALAILFPSECSLTNAYVPTWLLPKNCELVNQLYPVIFIVHLVWVTYIYIIDRNLFQRTLRNPIAKWVSAHSPLVGVLLGFAVSQSPSLFPLPVAAGGLLMGLLLIWSSYEQSFVGRFAEESLRLGLRTFFNMFFVLVLMGISMLCLWNDQTVQNFWDYLAGNLPTGKYKLRGEDIVLVWMYFSMFAMIYFWWHVRPDQQSRISLASRVALYDRTRVEEQPLQQ